jgi:glycosyltransferase involved in cell wall biosynthesis
VRVLHVINSIGVRAGAELSLIDILVGTASDELQHTVAVLDASDPPVSELTSADIEVQRPDQELIGRWAQMRFVREQIRRLRPDLVHSTLFDADLAARTAGWLERTPVLSSLVNMPYTNHGIQAETAKTWKLRAVRTVDGFLARHATAGFHAITDAVAQHAIERLRIDPAAVRVVPRGRSREHLGEPTAARRAQVRERMGWQGRTVLLNVARQEPQKGQVHLIEALASLRPRVPDVLLVVAGREGRSTPQLQAAVADHRLSEHVSFLGVRNDVPDLLVGADVFVFPSLHEGLGGAVIEAMGLDLPVVAFDTPAVREALDDGAAGRLAPVGDEAALARLTLEAAVGGQGEATRVRRARKHFDETYDLDRCLEGMQLLYRDVADQRGTGKWPTRRRMQLRT